VGGGGRGRLLFREGRRILLLRCIRLRTRLLRRCCRLSLRQTGFGWFDRIGNLQVGSEELEMIRRDFRRRILVMRTLDRSEG
jgi:hypothetical protein